MVPTSLVMIWGMLYSSEIALTATIDLQRLTVDLELIVFTTRLIAVSHVFPPFTCLRSNGAVNSWFINIRNSGLLLNVLRYQTSVIWGLFRFQWLFRPVGAVMRKTISITWTSWIGRIRRMGHKAEFIGPMSAVQKAWTELRDGKGLRGISRNDFT